MVDIYDEKGYTAKLLDGDISEKWRRDAALLTRQYKVDGFKKEDIKKKIKEKIRVANEIKHKNIPYVESRDCKSLKSVVNKAYNDGTELRSVREIIVSKDVVDWFIGLVDNYKINEAEIEQLRRKRNKCKNIQENILTWNRIKFMFTLYIWTRIQEYYLKEKPDKHYILNYIQKFKEAANLPKSYSVKIEGRLLNDLGLVDRNFALGSTTSFMNYTDKNKRDRFKNECFMNERTMLEDIGRGLGDRYKEGVDYFVLGTEGFTEGDIYKPGFWLEKHRMGSFICKRCGKEFAHYSKSKGEMGRKYCKECAKIIKNEGIGEEYKTIICIDCGEEQKVSTLDQQTCRCRECQKIESDRLHAMRQKAYRDKKKIESDAHDPIL